MSIWQQKFDLDTLNALGTNTINEVIEFEFIEIGENFLRAKMPVNNKTKQPFGILHGGVSVVMAETLGSVASSLCIKDPNLKTAVGVEVNANHLSSVRDGYVYGTVTPIRIGRSIHVWQIDITNEHGKKVCTSRLTTMVIEVN